MATLEASRFDMNLVSLQNLRSNSRGNTRMRLRTALSVSLVVSLALAATEKNEPLNVKVGLWQMTYRTERNGTAVVQSIAPELLAKVTPEQRNRTEARLRARAAQGLHVESRQYCLTEEWLRNAAFELEPGQACQRSTVTSTAKLQQSHEECIESGAKRSEEGRFEALDSDTLKGLLKVKAEGNAAFTMNMEIAGRWIGSDCGETAQ
jgi:hypothetical protein